MQEGTTWAWWHLWTEGLPRFASSVNRFLAASCVSLHFDPLLLLLHKESPHLKKQLALYMSHMLYLYTVVCFNLVLCSHKYQERFLCALPQQQVAPAWELLRPCHCRRRFGFYSLYLSKYLMGCHLLSSVRCWVPLPCRPSQTWGRRRSTVPATISSQTWGRSAS